MSSLTTGLLYPAFRSFIRNMHRYRVLLLALVLISALLTAVAAVVLGMREGIYEKASRYFAGNVVALGYIGDGDSLIESPEEVEESIKALEGRGIELRALSRRSTYYRQDSIELFFSGYWTKQRRLVGVEWELERPLLETFDFIAGGVPEEGAEDKVLISTATARQLNIGLGDELLVSIRSSKGRSNTAELTVAGIYAESSFFGYQTYLHRRSINRLKEVPEGRVNEIGLYLENPISDQRRAADKLVEEISRRLPSIGLLETREEYRDAARQKHDERSYGVVTVSAQLEEIRDLLSALTIVAGAVLVMFLGITVVGVSNTFTMIVWERTREVGTLRALGMQRGRAVATFLVEAALLGLLGAAAGMIVATAGLEAVRRLVDFPPNFATTLFLTEGRLRWLLPPSAILSIGGLVVLSSVAGSLRSAFRAGRMRPVDALS